MYDKIVAFTQKYPSYIYLGIGIVLILAILL